MFHKVVGKQKDVAHLGEASALLIEDVGVVASYTEPVVERLVYKVVDGRVATCMQSETFQE